MFIHGGYDLTDILCSVQIKQRRREGNVEKRKEEREGRRETDFPSPKKRFFTGFTIYI